MRRFVQHILPRGFPRVRSYGLLANRTRADHLTRCRELLGVPTEPPSPASSAAESAETSLPNADGPDRDDDAPAPALSGLHPFSILKICNLQMCRQKNVRIRVGRTDYANQEE